MMELLQDEGRAAPEAAARDAAPEARAILDLLPEAVLWWDARQTVQAANAAAEALLGEPGRELLGQRLEDLAVRFAGPGGVPLAPEDHPVSIALRSGEPVPETRLGLLCAGGAVRWLRVQARPVRADAAAAPHAVLFTAAEIPAEGVQRWEARFQDAGWGRAYIQDAPPLAPLAPTLTEGAQETPERRERRLHALHAANLLDTPPEDAFDRLTALVTRLLGVPVSLVSLVDADRQFFKSQVGLEAPYPARRETPLSHSFCQHVAASGTPLIVPDAHAHPLVCDNPAIQDLGVVAYLGVPLRTPDGIAIGSLCAIDSAARQWTGAEVEVMEGLAASAMAEIAARMHLQAREEAAAQLQRSERLFRTLFEAAPLGILLLDPETLGFVEFNAHAHRQLGYGREAFARLTLPDLWDGEADPTALVEHALADGYLRCEGLIQTCEGDVRTVELILQRLDASDRPGVLALLHDVTERTQTEAVLRTLNETLEERVRDRTAELTQLNRRLTRRNQELQHFAYVASHDLQEPLRKISAFAGLMREDYHDRLDDEGHFYLDRMEHAARRMARLLHDLLEYSRVVTHGSPFEATDLEGAAREALAELEQAGEAGEARVEIEALPEIEADPRQLRSLFRHLFSNAIKFRREGVPPEVHVRAEVERPGVGPALCRLTVQDNGLGFAEKYSERIFMPFERLHGRTTYPGTGMGLAISRRIAERHSGTIAARSTPGEGSVFIVRLPIRQERYGCEA